MSDTKAAQPYNASILTSLSFVQLLEALLLLTACCSSFVYIQTDFQYSRGKEQCGVQAAVACILQQPCSSV